MNRGCCWVSSKDENWADVSNLNVRLTCMTNVRAPPGSHTVPTTARHASFEKGRLIDGLLNGGIMLCHDTYYGAVIEA